MHAIAYDTAIGVWTIKFVDGLKFLRLQTLVPNPNSFQIRKSCRDMGYDYRFELSVGKTVNSTIWSPWSDKERKQHCVLKTTLITLQNNPNNLKISPKQGGI